jgi:chromosomal replication initiation ATPase DnaA
MVALQSLQGGPIHRALADQALEDHFTPGRSEPDAAAILRTVAAYFCVTKEQLFSRARGGTITWARAVCSYLMRRHTRLSFPEIARALGTPNHSTVLNSNRRVKDGLAQGLTLRWKTRVGEQEAGLRVVIDAIEREFGCAGDGNSKGQDY